MTDTRVSDGADRPVVELDQEAYRLLMRLGGYSAAAAVPLDADVLSRLRGVGVVDAEADTLSELWAPLASVLVEPSVEIQVSLLGGDLQANYLADTALAIEAMILPDGRYRLTPMRMQELVLRLAEQVGALHRPVSEAHELSVSGADLDAVGAALASTRPDIATSVLVASGNAEPDSRAFTDALMTIHHIGVITVVRSVERTPADEPIILMWLDAGEHGLWTYPVVEPGTGDHDVARTITGDELARSTSVLLPLHVEPAFAGMLLPRTVESPAVV